MVSEICNHQYFLQHKIATGAKGNLFGLGFLSTETQEDMAANYLKCDPSARAADLTAGSFLNHLQAGKYPTVLFQKALEFVGVIPPYYDTWGVMNRTEQKWKHTLVLAQFVIYLIDFYQELAQDPQWEEHRVFFVRLVKQWNADINGKSRYLYVHGDLNSDNYLDTFPSNRTSRQSAVFSSSLFRMAISCVTAAVVLEALYFTGILAWKHVWPLLLFFVLFLIVEKIGRPLSYLIKWCGLNIRGSRFGRRHYPKRIGSKGVTVKASNRDYVVEVATDLKGVHEHVLLWLHERLLDG